MPQGWIPSLTLANLLAWMAQAFALLSMGALLPLVFRIRHPWTRLAYCHALLLACLALPWIQPWRHPVIAANSVASALSMRNASLILLLLLAGATVRLIWLFAGLWRIRRHRIASTPLYPIPESVRAAGALTQADALFCVSSELPGPVMLGWLAPVVLLPESFLPLAEEAQCGIACHELLHVRRHDWLVTLFEEAAGALLWFNPGIWLLLAQARLAREQLVDAEAVRLTASREPYIDALLAIARRGSSLDLAPAPLFLRRRHLTQRVHSLLKESSTSPLRLSASYLAIIAALITAGWSCVAAFPLMGEPIELKTAPAVIAPANEPPPPEPAPVSKPVALPVIPPETQQDLASLDRIMPDYLPSATVPSDPHELVAAPVQALNSPGGRAAALALFARAQQNAKLHMASTPPFRFDVTFSAAGGAMNTGSGRLTEVRASGQNWRWTVDVGDYSLVRLATGGRTLEQRSVSSIPMRAQMLRQAIFWSQREHPSGTQIRSAEAHWNGSAVTCLLFSNVAGKLTLTPGRLWEEDEYCIDNTTGLLQIYSIAPGIYIVYNYSREVRFNGQRLPNHITIYLNGAMAADADFSIADMSSADASLLTPEPGMVDASVTTGVDIRTQLRVPGPSQTSVVLPVLIHAQISGTGQVMEEEVAAASDPALVQDALDLVRKTRFASSGTAQRQAYINVRFVPTAGK